MPAIRGLLQDRERLADMGRSAKALRRPEAAQRIAAELTALATGALGRIGTAES